MSPCVNTRHFHTLVHNVDAFNQIDGEPTVAAWIELESADTHLFVEGLKNNALFVAVVRS